MTLEILIVDTNVVVSGLITGDAESPTARILDSMLDGSLRFVVSEALVGEYLAVLNRPAIVKFHGLTSEEIETIVRRIVRNAGVVEPSRSADDAPDPGDQHLWDLLGELPGALLVTGDARLKRSKKRARVVSPVDLLAD